MIYQNLVELDPSNRDIYEDVLKKISVSFHSSNIMIPNNATFIH